MRKAEFERSFKRKRKKAESTEIKICCVVVSLRERRLRKQKKSATARLLKGKTTNKGRVADLCFVYLNTLYRLFHLAAKVVEKNGKNGKTYFDITIAVIMAERIHLFPFRTQKLSFLTPKVLSGTPLGRIGHRRFSVFRSL